MTNPALNHLAPDQQLTKISADGLCLGCGLCAAMAPDNISIIRGGDGDLQAVADAGLSAKDMALVRDICPSLRVEGLPADEIAKAPHNDTIWGPFHEMSLGYAADSAIRHEASTAGILTILAIYLLETGMVDAICHVKAATSPANFGVATISRSREDVIAASGSRYGPTAALINLEDILASDDSFAMIAKPCDLNGLRNLAHHDKRVEARIPYMLTMLCGGFQPDEAFLGFLGDHNLSQTGLTQVRYRGFGCPGPTTLSYEDGTAHAFHYLDFWGEDESQWSMPLRCKICPDGIGEAADIVAGDAWEGASPDRDLSETDEGFNTVITRTAKGDALYRAAVAAGVIVKTEQVDVGYLSSVQPHQVTKKLAGQARVDGLQAAGSVAPNLVNMRADALSDMLGESAYKTQRDGSYQRAMAKRAKR